MMLKQFFSFFLIVYFCSFSVSAEEIFLAELKTVSSNTLLEFQYKQTHFVCKPYGVITLETLYTRSKKDSVCRKNIEEFYKKEAALAYYVLNHLSTFQRYHVILKQHGECIIYSNGETTLSQKLLEKGLALKQKNFKDLEFRFLFTQAQKSARLAAKGLWKEKIYQTCKGVY